jgi:hypothetical protein
MVMVISLSSLDVAIIPRMAGLVNGYFIKLL